MKDFWVSSGHHLLDRDDEGRLVLTEEFLKAYFARPELMPPEDACDAERRLHESLIGTPRRTVSADEIASISDPDARENWEVMLEFRDRLTAAPSLEGAYLALVRGDMGRTPLLFVNQLTQVILRNALDRTDDPAILRAAELLFRAQKASVHEGNLLLADAEIIELHEEGRRNSPLIAMFNEPTVTELDVLDDTNAAHYFHRSDAFDMVLSFGGGPSARQGLARALEIWTAHLLGVRVTIEPVARAEDADWAWFVGLDAEATRIGNALWRGEDMDDTDLDRIIGLFRLTFDEPGTAVPDIDGRPIWLILAMGKDRQVRLKPQNLIVGLPLRTAEEVN